MSADVPERRRRPMLTMADMGMMMSADMGGGMSDGAPAGSHDADTTAADTRPQQRRELPTADLPASVKHGRDTHGPGRKRSRNAGPAEG